MLPKLILSFLLLMVISSVIVVKAQKPIDSQKTNVVLVKQRQNILKTSPKSNGDNIQEAISEPTTNSVDIGFNHPANFRTQHLEGATTYYYTDILDIREYIQAEPYIALSAFCTDVNAVNTKLFFRRKLNHIWSEWIELERSHEGWLQKDRIVYELYPIEEAVDEIQFKSNESSNGICKFRLYFPSSTLNFKKENKALSKNKVYFNTQDEPSANLLVDPTCNCIQPQYCDRNCWDPSGTHPPDPTPTLMPIATHISVHHSTANNSSTNFPQVVRGIWDWHVNGQGWDDIGYNWLIDANGIVYEGRGDGIQGSHFSCMNQKVIGICLIGDFSTLNPTTAAIDQLKKMIAWNSCKYQIDIMNTGLHANSGLNINNLCGHRDSNPSPSSCNNSTACPGNVLYGLLSNIKNNVSNFPCLNPCTNLIDPFETNNNQIPYNITLNSGQIFNNNHAHNQKFSYICSSGDVDRFTINISHKGLLGVTLSQLPADYQLAIYKNGLLIDQSTNVGTANELVEFEQTTNATETIEIKVWGNGSTQSASIPYSLTLTWEPIQTWFEALLSGIIHLTIGNVAEASGGNADLFISGNSTICSGQNTQLTASMIGCSGINYAWIPSTGLSCINCPNPIASPTSTTTYTVMTTSMPGVSPASSCYTSKEFTVNVTSAPNANAGPDRTINSGSGTTLTGSGGSTYSWTPSNSLSNSHIWNPYATPSSTTTYTLTVSNAGGCTDTDQMTVNVTSPNGSAPTNDNPCAAQTLYISSTCNSITGTNVNATSSSVPTPSTCAWSSTSSNPSGNYQGGDVWYKVTVPASGQFIAETQIQSSITDLVMVLYSGSTCSSLNEIICNDDRTPGSNYMPRYHVTGRTPGETIWIRVYEFGNNNHGNFGICAYDPYSNGGGQTNGSDLTSSILSVSNSNPDVNDPISITYKVENSGNQNISNTFVSGLYLSTNLTWSSNDVIVVNSGSVFSGLNAGASQTTTKNVTVPNVPDGNYYLICNPDVAGGVSETNTGNNLSFRSIQIGNASATGPNLDITDLDVTPSSGLAPGQEVIVEVEVENDGTDDADDFNVLIFFDINGNGNFDPNLDEELVTVHYPDLDEGDDDRRDRDVHLPVSIPSTGSYDIIAIADIDNEVNEIDEGDNDRNTSVNVSTVTPAGPDLVPVFDKIELRPQLTVVSPSSLCLDSDYELNYGTTNIGNLDASGGFSVYSRAYISENLTLDGDDVIWDVSWTSAGTYDVGDTVFRSDNKVLVGFAPGNYNLLLFSDTGEDIQELNEGNNMINIPIFLNHCSGLLPDLAGEITGYSPYTSALGDYITTDLKVWNQGDTAISDFYIRMYVSEDLEFNGSGFGIEDMVLNDSGDVHITSTLLPGDTITLTLSGYTNGLDYTGIYYLMMSLDDYSDHNEISKANNIEIVPIEIGSVDCYFRFSSLNGHNDTISHHNFFDYLFRVDTEDSCTYAINAVESWISQPRNRTSTGYDVFLVIAEENPYPFPRIGHIDVGGTMYEFIQLGTPCDSLDDSIAIDIDSVITHMSCGVSGEIDITVFDGYPPYSFSWAQTGDSTEDVFDLVQAGNYVVSITDQAGCVFTDTFVVNSTGALFFTKAVEKPSCASANDGTITLFPWGNPNFSLQWWDGDTSLIKTGLAASTYSYQAISSSCTIWDTVTILDPLPLSIDEVIVDAYCLGYNNGAIGIVAAGGYFPFTYLWSNGETTKDLVNVPPGNYTITLTDARNCQLSDSFIIGQQNQAYVGLAYPNLPVCIGDTIFAFPSDGNHMWSTGDTTFYTTISDTGIYAVSMVQLSGCHAGNEVSITSIISPQAAFSYTIDSFTVAFSDSSQFATNWQWDFGDGGFSTNQNPIHVYATAGSYTVTQTVTSNACGGAFSFSQVVIIPDTIPIDSTPTIPIRVSIFPNPTSGDLTIEVSNFDGDLEISIINQLGQSIWDDYTRVQNNSYITKVSSNDLAAGLYHVRVRANANVYREKVIVID